jgi:hypothetical protein
LSKRNKHSDIYKSQFDSNGLQNNLVVDWGQNSFILPKPIYPKNEPQMLQRKTELQINPNRRTKQTVYF